MSMMYICLCHICLLSAVLYGSPRIDPSPPWLDVSLGVCVCVAIINGIVFFIWFSAWTLLVYRNVTNFCTLILQPKVLLKSFIRLRSLLAEVVWFSRYIITLSVKADSLSSSSISKLFIPFLV